MVPKSKKFLMTREREIGDRDIDGHAIQSHSTHPTQSQAMLGGRTENEH